MSAAPKTVNIQTLRKNVYSTLQTKEAVVHSRTYQALLEKYYLLQHSKVKLTKFHADIQQYTKNVNTKAKLQQEKRQVAVAKSNLRTIFRSNAKVISFYITLYKPKYPNYKGHNLLHYEGEEYVPMSKSTFDGAMGSFFFSKKYAIGHTHIMAQLRRFQYIKSDIFQTATGQAHELFAEFDGFEDFIPIFTNVIMSQEDVLIVMNQLKVDEARNEPINYAAA